MVYLSKICPFVGKFDLPGGKIEHREANIDALVRELNEELGLLENDYCIKNIISVEEDFVLHPVKNNIQKDEHIIAIVYHIEIFQLNEDYIEEGGDSAGILLLDKNDNTIPKTPIFEKIIGKI